MHATDVSGGAALAVSDQVRVLESLKNEPERKKERNMTIASYLLPFPALLLLLPPSPHIMLLY